MKLALDATPKSVVVTCSACPPWRALVATRAEGWAAASDHARRVHGNARHADTLAARSMSQKMG